MKHSPGFLKIVDKVKPFIKEITPEEIMLKFNHQEPFHFIDVREDSEWDSAYAQGAVHLSKGIIERDIEQVVPNHNDCIVLYCGGGYRSALAAYNLQEMGYNNVYSLKGGYRAWNEKLLPIIKNTKN